MNAPWTSTETILPSHIDIHAQVTDEMGYPLIALVWIRENINQTAATDFDTGEFSLSQVDYNHTLVVSYQDIEKEYLVKNVGRTIKFPTEELPTVDLGTVKTNKTNWLAWVLGTALFGGVIYVATREKEEEPVIVNL